MKRIFQIKRSVALFAAAVFVSGGAGMTQDMPTLPEPDASAPTLKVEAGDDSSVREIKMLPTHKRSLALKEEERNPYARRTPDLTIDKNESGEETEFDRIRSVLTGLEFSGRTYGPRGIRLLAGNIIFEAGKEVPPVVMDQTERQVVENVTDESVTIVWLDSETGEPTENRLTLTYDLSVRVRYVLAGQTMSETGEDKEDIKFGVLTRKSRTGDGKEESEAVRRTRATASRYPNGVSEEAFKQGQ